MENNRPPDLHKKPMYAELYPLPFKKGGSLAPMSKKPPVMEAGGDMGFAPNLKPKPLMSNNTLGKGGPVKQETPPKTSFGDTVKGLFNREQRTENRYNKALRTGMTGGGSSSFKSASKFTLPTSGQTVKRGERVLATPYERTQVVTPGTPATKGTPATTKKVITGYNQDFIPEFAETGNEKYGKPAEGAPGAGSTYNQLPPKMNPRLKAAILEGIKAKQTTVMYNNMPYKAGRIDSVPIFGEETTPGTPGTPGTAPVTENVKGVHFRSGGMSQSSGFGGKDRLDRVPWLPGKRNPRTEGNYGNTRFN